MRRIATVSVLLLIALTLSLPFSVPVSCATDNETLNSEIERIEYGDNVKTTYYKNGTKLVEVFAQTTIVTTVSATTTTTTATVITPPPINIVEVLQIVSFIVTIVSVILGIFGVKLYIGSKKKPSYVVISNKKIPKEV